MNNEFYFHKKKTRKRCFTTDYFKGCLDALQLSDEIETIKTYIKQVNGAQPPVLNH